MMKRKKQNKSNECRGYYNPIAHDVVDRIYISSSQRKRGIHRSSVALPEAEGVAAGGKAGD